MRWVMPLLFLLAFSSMAPAHAQADTTITLETSGRELRIPLYEGYVRSTESDPALYEMYASFMNRGKLSLLEVLVASKDIELTNQGLDPDGMIFKIGTDALFGTEEVIDEIWERKMPAYRAALSGMDADEIEKIAKKRFEDVINEQLPEGTEIDSSDITRPLVYRSEPYGFRMVVTSRIALKVNGHGKSTPYIGFVAVVNLRGRVFILAAEVVAPEDAEGRLRKRDEFDRFVDQIIAINGGRTRA